MPLSPTQQRIYEMIKSNLRLSNQAPTISEIGRAMNLSSTSTVHALLVGLEREGLIKRSRKHRGIELVEKT